MCKIVTDPFLIKSETRTGYWVIHLGSGSTTLKIRLVVSFFMRVDHHAAGDNDHASVSLCNAGSGYHAVDDRHAGDNCHAAEGRHGRHEASIFGLEKD